MKTQTVHSIAAWGFWALVAYVLFALLPFLYDRNGILMDQERPRTLHGYHRKWWGGVERRVIQLRRDPQDGEEVWMSLGDDGSWNRVWFSESLTE